MPLFCSPVSWSTIWRVINTITKVCGSENTPVWCFNCDVSVIRPSLQNTKMALIVRPPRDSNLKVFKATDSSQHPKWFHSAVLARTMDQNAEEQCRMFENSPECSKAVQNSNAECSGRLELPLKFNFHVIIISWAYSRVSFHIGTRVVTEVLYDHSLCHKDKIWSTLILDTRGWSCYRKSPHNLAIGRISTMYLSTVYNIDKLEA